MIEVMEHIRKGSQEHTSGSFDITENISLLTPATYLRAILSLPFSDRAKKRVPVFHGPNLSNPEKDFPERPGVGSPGRYAAPGQALPLYVNQASLHYDIRPELSDNPYYIGIAVHRKALRVQSIWYQLFKEFPQLWLRILGDAVLPGYKRVTLGIHQGNKATGAMKESPVQDKVIELSQAKPGLRRSLLQIMVNHTVKLSRTVSTLICQLSGRITFDNPSSKPFLLFGLPGNLIISAVSAIRVPTKVTEPTLFSFCIMTVSPENA